MTRHDDGHSQASQAMLLPCSFSGSFPLPSHLFSSRASCVLDLWVELDPLDAALLRIGRSRLRGLGPAGP